MHPPESKPVDEFVKKDIESQEQIVTYNVQGGEVKEKKDPSTPPSPRRIFVQVPLDILTNHSLTSNAKCMAAIIKHLQVSGVALKFAVRAGVDMLGLSPTTAKSATMELMKAALVDPEKQTTSF